MSLLISMARRVWRALFVTRPGRCPICRAPGPEEGHTECLQAWSIK